MFSADNRLTYSIVALDGTGVLLEAARAAKAVVDDKLMRKYAGPPQWSAPPANDDHEATSAQLPQLPRLPPSSASSGVCWLVGVCPQQWHLCRVQSQGLDASTAGTALKASRSSS